MWGPLFSEEEEEEGCGGGGKEEEEERTSDVVLPPRPRERERETQEPLLFLPPSLQSVPAFSPNIALFFAHLLARPPLPSTCTTMGVWKTQKPMRKEQRNCRGSQDQNENACCRGLKGNENPFFFLSSSCPFLILWKGGICVVCSLPPLSTSSSSSFDRGGRGARRERGGEAEKEGGEGPPASSSPRRRLEGPRASSMLSSSRAPPALSHWNGRGRASSSSSSSFVPHPHFSQPPLSAQPPPGPTQGTRGKASKEDRTEQGEQAPLNPFVFASYLLQKLAIGSTRSRGRKGERGWSCGRDTLLHRSILKLPSCDYSKQKLKKYCYGLPKFIILLLYLVFAPCCTAPVLHYFLLAKFFIGNSLGAARSPPTRKGKGKRNLESREKGK